jgi:hypothetical protein
MADVKITKKDWYAQIKAVVEASAAENKDEMVGFIDHEVELLDAKAAKAAERAASKKTEGDELRAKVQAVLTDELQDIATIAAQVESEDITKAKVTARLTQLVNAGVAEKDIIKAEDSRKVTAYKLASKDTDVE